LWFSSALLLPETRRKSLKRDKFLDCPQIQSLKKAHTVQMDTRVNKKRANYRPRFPLKGLESSSATPQQAVQKQPGKMMIKCDPLQPPNPFFCGESSLQTEC